MTSSGGQDEATATVLLVFGRGVVATPDGIVLTEAGTARVTAAIGYVRAHTAAYAAAAAPRIVFTGGWPEASTGVAAPPAGAYEGDLMLGLAYRAGLHHHAQLRVENRSRSTLENLLNTVRDGLLDGYRFDARHPLGLVTHPWHAPRVRLLAGRILGLRGPALLDVPAHGGERHDDRIALLAARLGCLGTRRGEVLLRRERRVITALRLARRITRRSADDSTEE
ncbi:YdcF family protein [Actinoplanes sp. KI2]|uniref:ElyC/SanA/YdcF family protein n=1 Tax=Actinoplanes sp. KI2 TaxID=2983315 RepID=UPI0021D5FB27|nr:ElyC/SanA/YdcF family protein [Actinoplanes sp. KI2]MCU7730056.1 YdcF family protein [Actinoplanes sp. KI2]